MLNIGQGGIEGATRHPGGYPARPPPGRATRAPGPLVVALWSHFGDSESFRDAEFLYNFSGIFGALLKARKPKIQKQQKTGTGTGVH